MYDIAADLLRQLVAALTWKEIAGAMALWGWLRLASTSTRGDR